MQRKPPVPNVIGEEFMEFTHYEYLGPSDQTLGMEPPALESPIPGQVGDPSDDSMIQLAPPDDILGIVDDLTVTEAIRSRKSIRNFKPEPLTLIELSYLLWMADGVKAVRGVSTFRTAPSAGARHPLESYLLVNRVEGVPEGLYRYVALSHKLVALDLSEAAGNRIREGLMDQGLVTDSAFTIIWTAVPYRSAWRYGERAYRYIHLDAGHVCQNLYLASAAVGCGCCAIAAFEDDYLNSLLGVDGKSEFAIYAASVGKQH